MVFIARRHDGLNDDQTPVGDDDIADVTQDSCRACVVPVMQDELEHVGIGPRWDCIEEVAGHNVASWGDRGQNGTRTGYRLRHVEKHAPGSRIRGQQRCQERPLPAADIDNGTRRREIAGGQDGRNLQPRLCTHQRLESRELVRMPGQVVEESRAVRVPEGSVTIKNRIAESSPR